MRCPLCSTDDSRVVDSRDAEDGAAIRRRRHCPECGHRFTTFERLEEVPLFVRKRTGEREPFDRSKIVRGVQAAAKGRTVSLEDIVGLSEAVEDSVRAMGPEVTSTAIGLAVLDHLRAVDEIAYLRFASVYKNFDDAADFQRELQLLEKTSAPA